MRKFIIAMKLRLKMFATFHRLDAECFFSDEKLLKVLQTSCFACVALYDLSRFSLFFLDSHSNEINVVSRVFFAAFF